MICRAVRRDETYLVKDNKDPDIQLCVFAPVMFPTLARATEREDQSWHVCSANILQTKYPRPPKSDEMLAAFRKALDASPECGGPRPFGEHDRVCCDMYMSAHSMSDERKGNFVRPDDALLHALAEGSLQHPAWKGGLGFMLCEGITVDLINILNDIYDMRRFSALGKGRSRNNLRSYFRLINAEYLKKIIGSDEVIEIAKVPIPFLRLLSFVRLWQTPITQWSEALAPTIPSLFLSREWKSHIKRFRAEGVAREEAVVLGAYRVSLRALEFLHLTWLSGLGVITFEPEKFFHYDWEAEAFKTYMSKIT